MSLASYLIDEVIDEVRVATDDANRLDMLARKYTGKLRKRTKRSWYYAFPSEGKAEDFGLELLDQGYDVKGPVKSGSSWLIVIDWTV